MYPNKENEHFLTEDGSSSLFSNQFETLYHSKHGALNESRHVFIQAGLVPMASIFPTVRILEMGFGTGLNAILAQQFAQNHQIPIRFTSFEQYPIDLDLLDALNYCTTIPYPKYLFEKIHFSQWNQWNEISENFLLHKRQDDILLLNDSNEYNLVFFDAFSPNEQPELWEPIVFEKIYNALVLDGCLVTYCAKGQVKRNLRSVGFEVESLPGPPGKREMTRAWKK